jgi:hypothetical protein
MPYDYKTLASTTTLKKPVVAHNVHCDKNYKNHDSYYRYCFVKVPVFPSDTVAAHPRSRAAGYSK